MEYVAGCTLRDVLRERGRAAAAGRAGHPGAGAGRARRRAPGRVGAPRREAGERADQGTTAGSRSPTSAWSAPSDTVTSTTGAVLGTVSYLAPEQIEHGTADPRVDVYACGVVLYEMLTGGKPHVGDTPAQVLYQHLHEDVPPPSAAVPGLPYALDELVAVGDRPQPRGCARTTRSRCSAQVREARAGAHRRAARRRTARRPLAAGHDNAERPYERDPALAVRAAPAAGRTRATSDGGDARPAPDQPVRADRRLESGPPAAPAAAAHGPRRGMLAIVAAVAAGARASARASGTSTPASSPRSRRCWRQTEAQARHAARATAGLDVGQVEHAYSDTVKRGTVISTDPGAGRPDPGATTR